MVKSDHAADAVRYEALAVREERLAALMARTADALFELSDRAGSKEARRSLRWRGDDLDGVVTEMRRSAARLRGLAEYARVAAEPDVNTDLTEGITRMFSR